MTGPLSDAETFLLSDVASDAFGLWELRQMCADVVRKEGRVTVGPGADLDAERRLNLAQATIRSLLERGYVNAFRRAWNSEDEIDLELSNVHDAIGDEREWNMSNDPNEMHVWIRATEAGRSALYRQ